MSIRVDGRDVLSQPIPEGSLGATSGKIRFRWTPRHSSADAVKFGESAPRICDIRKNANNFIVLYWSGANTIQLYTNVAGGGDMFEAWDATGAIVAGTEYLVEIEYSSTEVKWSLDGVVKATETRAVDFGANILDVFNAGTRSTGTGQADSTFGSPS